MKKILIALILSVSLVSAGFAAERHPVDSLWGHANTHYINRDYHGAIEDYEAIANDGYVSGKLFYNLGNAYFKAGNIGRSILNYNKALKLSPYDKDVEYNLAVANGFVKDNIDAMPEFPLLRWVRAIGTSLDTNVWAALSLAFFALTLGCTILFLLSERGNWRKVGFFSGVGFAALFVIAAFFASAEKRDITDPREGVIMTQAVSVKSAPESAGRDIFILHEGTKVYVVSSLGEWREIMIADGNKGWISTSDMELIY